MPYICQYKEMVLYLLNVQEKSGKISAMKKDMQKWTFLHIFWVIKLGKSQGNDHYKREYACSDNTDFQSHLLIGNHKPLGKAYDGCKS